MSRDLGPRSQPPLVFPALVVGEEDGDTHGREHALTPGDSGGATPLHSGGSSVPGGRGGRMRTFPADREPRDRSRARDRVAAAFTELALAV